jgi:hypothetical protein
VHIRIQKLSFTPEERLAALYRRLAMTLNCLTLLEKGLTNGKVNAGYRFVLFK